MNFNQYDHNFCESTIYSNLSSPEYANSISSLFISWIGFFGLSNPQNNFSSLMLYSALLINGFTSCGYHYYNSIGWGLLDRMSMILIAMSSTYLFIQHIHLLFNSNKWICNSSLEKIIHVMAILYFTLLFTICGLHWENIFNILFGFFLSNLVLYMIIIDKYQEILYLPKIILDIGWSGIFSIIFSASLWIITESFCNYLGIFKYLFGHVWWHIYVSYGGYLVSIVPLYLYMNSTNNNNLIVIKYKFCIPFLDFNN